MSAALAVALPVQPTRAVLVAVQDRQHGGSQIVELEPQVARQIAADLIQAADLAEARKLRGRTTCLALVSDVSTEREGA